jgi:methionine aminotransferase
MNADPEHYLESAAFYQAKRDRFRSAAGDRASRCRGRRSVLPAGRLFRDQRPGRPEHSARWLTVEKGVAAIPLSPFYECRRRAIG